MTCAIVAAAILSIHLGFGAFLLANDPGLNKLSLLQRAGMVVFAPFIMLFLLAGALLLRGLRP